MFAIDHAATALLLERRYPTVRIWPLLLSVQAMELAWVLLNYLGIERTTTGETVRSVADIHLAWMPWSHSAATAIAAAVLAWITIEHGFGRRALGRAIGLGIASHLVLDLLTHAHDIALWPGAGAPRIGLGLYDVAPLAAFFLEMAYGIVCWSLARERRVGLLAVVVLGNLANLSLLSGVVPGPEVFLAGRPLLVVTLVLVQILVTMALVSTLSRPRRERHGSSVTGCAAKGRT